MRMPREEALHTLEVNGITLRYAVTGEGAPVVLVHGNGEDHSLFDTEVRQLAEAGYRVYAPDSRGHGANPPLPEYHYADMAEDMYWFIAALGLERPALYGHSDGGIVGLMLEMRHPGTLGRLAASGANLSPEGLDPAFLAECRERNENGADPLVTLMLTEPAIAPEELEKIGIPVLLTAGERDLVLRGETLSIAAHLKSAHTVILAGEDHGSYVSGSPIMGELLLRFLREEPAPGKALTVKAETRFLETATAFLDGEREREACAPRARMQIDVATDEIFSNVVNYAYPERDNGTVTVRFSCADGEAAISFEDGGIPYNPLGHADPDPTLPLEERDIGGLGIFLVKKTMDGVDYRREDGRNVLVLRKRIRP